MNYINPDICRMTCLCVEDDHDIAMMLRYFISKKYLSHLVVYAENGLDAIAKAKEYKPDVYLVDLSMPLMGGRDLIERIFEFDSDAEIVVLSVEVDPRVIKGCIDLGIRRYLVKPVIMDELFQTMDQLMENVFWKRLRLAQK